MSDWDDDDNDINQQQGNKGGQGGGLRAQLEAALKANKELRGELDKTKAQLRTEAVARVVQAKGLKPKVSKLIPADVEPTEEAITKWLEEWGDVFGGESLKETPAEPEKPKVAVEANADDDLNNAAYADRMRALGQATGQGAAPMKDEDLMRKLNDPGLERKDLMALIHAAGGGVGTG